MRQSASFRPSSRAYGDVVKYRELFKVAPASTVRLSTIDPDFHDKHDDKAAADAEIQQDNQRLRDLQYLLYAEHERSLLICLQGLDASGKDGTIAHVFGALNPQGARVHAFKVPSQEEADHDFLWRAHRQTPAKGEIVIFNRSHYEDVLVVRVHGLVPESTWSRRFELINDFEKNLVASGTIILKFYLHISEQEQLRRFKDRLDDPTRRWKVSEADYAERSYFPQYLAAYEETLARTSTADSPWFVIPANHKWFRNLAVSKIVVETLESLSMTFPPPSVDIEEIRRKYHAAKQAETSS
jgi:PPK2 family polyphosphate:nucleotide phosphotransferase